MSKLDTIPKKDFSQAPEGYFDSLPNRIRKRLEEPEKVMLWYQQPALKMAFAILLLAIIGIGWWQNNTQVEPVENLLAVVETDDLISYLAEEENLENLLLEEDLTTDDVLAIEDEVFNQTIDETLLENYLDELDENSF